MHLMTILFKKKNYYIYSDMEFPFSLHNFQLRKQLWSADFPSLYNRSS